MSDEPPVLEAELAWARLNVGVVPCADRGPGSLVPLIEWQEVGPLLGEDRVRAFFAEHPHGAFAITLDNSAWGGPRLGCVDDDSGKHPPPADAVVPAPFGGYAETTRTAGRHLLFRYDVELPPGFATRVTGLRGFVDVFTGGLMYAAPSVNRGRGEYRAVVGLGAGIPAFPSVRQALEASAAWLYPAWLEKADGSRDPEHKGRKGEFSECYRLAVRAVAYGASDDQVREAVGCDHPEWSPKQIHRTTERIRAWLAKHPLKPREYRLALPVAVKRPGVHTVSLGDRGKVEHSADAVRWIREGVKVDTTWTVIDSHFEVVERLAVDGETYYRVRQDRERLLRAPDLYRLLDDSGAIIDHRNARDALSAVLRDETRDRVRAGHAALGVYPEANGSLTLCTDPVPLTDEQSEVLQDAGPNVGLVPTADDVRPHVEIAARFDPDEAYPVVGLSALGAFVQVLRSRGILVPHVFHVSHRSGLGKSTIAVAFTERLYGRRSVSADAVGSEFRIAALLDGGLPLTLEEGEKLDTARLSAALKDAAERERFSKRGTKDLGLVVFLSRSLIVITGNRFPFTSGPTQVRFLAPAFNAARYAERRTPEARQEFDANFARLRPVGFAVARFVLGLYPTLPDLVSAVEVARRELEGAAGTYPWHDSRRSQAWALVLLGLRTWAAFARSHGVEWPRPDLLEPAAFFSTVVQPVERATFESELYPVQRFRFWFEVWRAKNRTTSQRTLVRGGSELDEVSYHEEIRGEGQLFEDATITVGERKVVGSWVTGGLLDAYNREQAVEARVESLSDLARQAADAAGFPRDLVVDLEGYARQYRFSHGAQVRAAFVPEVLEK